MTNNLLPLYTFFEIIGYHPWHALGVGGTGTLKVTSDCNDIVRRYNWQNVQAAGHQAVEQAIEQAETRLREYLGFSVAPHYVSETLAWPHTDPYSGWQSITLTEGQIRAVGVEALTSISTGAAVAYSDADGDGVDDTFTVSAATTITDTSQIAVYFSAGDRFNGWGATTAIGARWRVQPVTVTISGGTVTVRGSKVLCVKPIKYEGVTNVGANGLDPTDATNFVTTLDLYQRYTGIDGNTTTTSQAVIIWESYPCHGYWCCCASCAGVTDPYSGSPHDPAATATAVARVGIRDARRGIVTPAEATYNATTGIWSSDFWTVCSRPDRVTVRYLAGYPLGTDGQMQEPYRTIVARLAAAELSERLCACDVANRELWRWSFDLARSAGNNDEAYGAVSARDLENPFGTRRGQVYAWKQVQRLHNATGFLP